MTFLSSQLWFRAGLFLLVGTTLVLVGISTAVAGQTPALRAALADEIADALQWPDAQIEVEDLQVVGAMPSEGWELRLRSGRLHGAVQAEVVASGTSRRRENTWVRARVTIEVPVYRASERIASGESLDFRYEEEWEDYSRLPRDIVADLSELSGRTARRAIRPGELLTAGLFEAPVVVERNDLVTLVVRRGTAVVSVRGQALQSGRQGDSIRVKNLGSDQVVVGIATGSQTVEVP